jgi:PAS domain S-box-containing protein
VISELVTNAIQNSEPFDVQLKIITASQNELWVRAIGKAELKDGKPVKLKGLFQDIDDLKRKEEQLTQNESALKEAEDLAQLGNWRWSFDRQERYWSDGRFKILGYEPGEIEPSLQVALDSVHPEDRERVEGTIKQAIEKDEDYELSYRIINQSNEVRIVKDKGVFVNLPHTKGQYYAGIVMDITDESLKEQKLQESLKALERSNRELQDFAYVASHDLQEPLRVITSYLQLIEMSYGHLLDDEGKLFIESIIKASARMKTLINDLLVLSRLETKQRDAVPVDLNKVINVVKEDLSLKIIDSNAEIKHPELPVVYGDEGRMRRLFQNFIGNSIKFRRPDVDPKIEIEWSDVGEKYQFKIKDNGIGIKEEYFERIFTIFQRLHTREEYEGTGIGLAICKKIVDKHDSTIRVESEYGKGSSFIFELNKSKG